MVIRVPISAGIRHVMDTASGQWQSDPGGRPRTAVHRSAVRCQVLHGRTVFRDQSLPRHRPRVRHRSIVSEAVDRSRCFERLLTEHDGVQNRRNDCCDCGDRKRNDNRDPDANGKCSRPVVKLIQTMRMASRTNRVTTHYGIFLRPPFH